MQVAMAAPRSNEGHEQPQSWRTWQSDGDREIRKEILTHIFSMFKRKRKDGNEEWQQRLPEFTKRLEEMLYRSAASLDEYKDKRTLGDRLARVARKLAPARAANATARSQPQNGETGLHTAGHNTSDNHLARIRSSNAAPAEHSHANQSAAHIMIPVPSVNPRTQPAQSAPVDSTSQAPMMIPNPGMEPPASSPHGPSTVYSGHNAPAAENPWDSRMMPNGSSKASHSTHVAAPVNGTAASPSTMSSRFQSGAGAPGTRPAPPANNNSMATRAGMRKAMPRNPQVREQIVKQQRLLLFLRHCAKCQDVNCAYRDNCKQGQLLWKHIIDCKDPKCQFNRCVNARELLRHYQKCEKSNCPICGPVRQYVDDAKRRQQDQAQGQGAGQPGPGPRGWSGPAPPPAGGAALAPPAVASGATASAAELLTNSGGSGVSSLLHSAPRMRSNGAQLSGVRRDRAVFDGDFANGYQAGAADPVAAQAQQQQMKRARVNPNMGELKRQLGTSLLETFTVEEIHAHVASTREDMDRSPAPRKAGSAPGGALVEEDFCQICRAQHTLRFEPPPRNCISCQNRIRKNQLYYVNQDPPAVWCSTCYSQAGETLFIENVAVPKATVASNKRKQAEVEGEPWVACDMCDMWVHMICGLFNKGSNKQDAKFLCPWCLERLQRDGRRAATKERPQSMLGAADLPTNALSDFLEAELRRELERDHVARAKAKGVPLAAEPRVENVTVRVVNVTDKIVETKDKFRAAFRPHNYPGGFPYRQKVILLFQKIEGVDVLLYIVYVQEYGENAAKPNRNTVYLSYLDSVKYFRPEGRDALNSKALRTKVYHEILHGYMAYAKRLGMNAIYIWSCPPLAGDDYVMYCHPHRQKNPRADRLREWYHVLLDEAQERGVVTYRSTLFDTFLPGGRDHARTEVSAMQLPYFEGDFWPGEAETQLTEIASAGKKGSTKRSKAGKGIRALGPATTDAQLLQRLADNTVGSHQNSMKEDFMVAHFKTPCSMCTQYCDGQAWVLNKRKEALPKDDRKQFDGIEIPVCGELPRPEIPRHFAVCNACHALEVQRAQRGEASRLPKQVTLSDLEVAECEPLARQAEDEGNHFQFDTLRRAKHSSMMTLYHLHNPGEPAFAGNCNSCGKDIDPGKGYKCKHKECADFEICQDCYQAGAWRRHPHPLVRAGVDDEHRQALTAEQRKMRVQTLRRTMMLLEHASSCKDPNCASKSCRKVKQLHQHAVTCTKKVHGGCSLCRHMWCLLSLHAKQCLNDNCPVPRCLELRELRRRQLSREQDSRRRQYMQWHRAGAGKPQSVP